MALVSFWWAWIPCVGAGVLVMTLGSCDGVDALALEFASLRWRWRPCDGAGILAMARAHAMALVSLIWRLRPCDSICVVVALVFLH